MAKQVNGRNQQPATEPCLGNKCIASTNVLITMLRILLILHSLILVLLWKIFLAMYDLTRTLVLFKGFLFAYLNPRNLCC